MAFDLDKPVRIVNPTSLANFWHPVATSESITERPIAVTLLEEPVVLFRRRDGRLAALKDVCVHRATALSLGWVENDNLVCPYHGWQYNDCGECVKIPSFSDGAAIPAAARTPSYRTEERAGVAWVLLGDQAMGLPDWPDREWQNASYHGFVNLTDVWEASAGRVVENFFDVAHLPWLHEGVLGDRARTTIEHHDIVSTERGFQFEYQNDDNVHGGGTATFTYVLEFPFTIHAVKRLADGRVTIVTLAASPLSDERTRMFSFIFRNYDLDGSDGPYREGSNRIYAQDKPIVESQRPRELPVGLQDELHLKVPDAAAMAYRRLMRDVGSAI